MVQIQNPAENQTFGAVDPVLVRCTVSDDELLGSLIIQVVHAGTGEIQTSNSFSLSGVEQTFEETLALGDLYSETGNYILRVTALDGSGNEAHDEIDIQLTEVPLELRKIFFTSGISGNETSGSMDSSGTVETGVFLGNYLDAFKVDSRNNSLVTINGPDLGLWDTETFQNWELQPIFGTNTLETGTGLFQHKNLYFITGDQEPQLSVMTASGAPFRMIDTLFSFTQTRGICGDFPDFFVSFININITGIIARYSVSTQELGHVANLGGELPFLMATAGPDYLLIATTDDLGSNLSLLLVDQQTLQVVQNSDMASEVIISMESSPSAVWLHTSAGIRKYDFGSLILGPLLIPGTFSSMGLNLADGTVLTGNAAGQIQEWNSTGTLLNTFSVSTQTIYRISCLYNK